MEAMTAAGSQIARELETFQATLRRVRQEAITAEIIELGTGAASASAQVSGGMLGAVYALRGQKSRPHPVGKLTQINAASRRKRI